MDKLLEARQIPPGPGPGGGRGQAHQSTHRWQKRSQPHLRQHVEKDGLRLNGHARPKQVSLLRHCPRQCSAFTWHGGPSSHFRHEGELPYRVPQIQSCQLRIFISCLWQNRMNYSGSSALVISLQQILTQRTSNRITHWSIGSPPNTTTVQQDRSRFTSHEGEFTIAPQLTNF
jgi:hypothetical protein